MAKSVSIDSLKMPKDSCFLQGSELEIVLLSQAYLAPVEYYVAMYNANRVVVEHCDNYLKQTYRNRCRISTANGTMDLSIPVDKSGKSLMRDIRISEHTDWQTQHWRSIETAYNSSPFFEYYIDDLKPFFEKKWLFLWDFNWEIQNKIIELLDVELKVDLTTSFELIPELNTLDLREKISPKKEAIFELKSYYQVFEQRFGFKPNLSIIDLLFNMGNESQLILKSD